MINLTISAHDGHLYELTSRYSQPQSSAAQIYRNDPYLTQRLIARFPVDPNTWLRILSQLGLRVQDLSTRLQDGIHHAVTNALLRGDLVLYKLPLLDSATSLRGKQDMGLCIIKGPKPHCATHLTAVPINSATAAQELLNELGIEPHALLAYLNSHNLYNSYDQQKPLEEVLKRLANGELLAYKIQLPPMSVPEKATEFVAATGPRYEPVPLGPETKAAKKVSEVDHKAEPAKKEPPLSLEEAEQRLIAAGPAVRAAKASKQPLPPSAYSLEDKQAVIENGLQEKYLIRVIETKYAGDEGFIGKVREQGHSVSWTAPFSMVEHGDTDPEALLKAFGTRHNPDSQYTILIIDREKMNEIGDVQTVIPTKQNLKNLIAKNPEISTLSLSEIDEVLSDELAPKYYKFAKEASKISANDKVKRIRLTKKMGFSSEESKKIIKRQDLADQVAAWEEFTGNGMTLDTTKTTPGRPVYGPVEVIVLDKKPMKIGDLKKVGALSSINC